VRALQPAATSPAALLPVFEAICAARTPKSALNWLRRDGGAAILAQLAAGPCPPLTRHSMPTPAGERPTSYARRW